VIFLVIYDRLGGDLITFEKYEDDQIAQANSDRLQAEIENATNGDVEIVILRSDSEEQVRRTHARYFETLAELESGFRARPA
jgi:hypothetical protein